MTKAQITSTYNRPKLMRDTSLALLAMTFLMGCLIVADVGIWLDAALAAGLVMFTIHLFKLWRRFNTILAWDQETAELQIEGRVTAVITWADLNDFSIRYYSTRRDRSGGWFDLTLTDSQGGELTLDSDLMDFDRFLTFAWAKARTHSVSPNSATHANLKALGLIKESD